MKTIARIKYLVFFAIITTVNSCCKKDKEPTLFPLLQETKDWMFFDTGTYWVYREMNSGVEDSQYVISSVFKRLGPDPDPSEPQRIDEAAVVEINSGFSIYLGGTGGAVLLERKKE